MQLAATELKRTYKTRVLKQLPLHIMGAAISFWRELKEPAHNRERNVVLQL